METNPHSTSSGGFIYLQARLANLFFWLGPAWAATCGVVASNSSGWGGDDWLLLALLILLVDGGWGTLWAALGGTNWAKPLRRWRNWRFGEPVSTPPYTLPDSPGDRASRWLGQLRAWKQMIEDGHDPSAAINAFNEALDVLIQQRAKAIQQEEKRDERP